MKGYSINIETALPLIPPWHRNTSSPRGKFTKKAQERNIGREVLNPNNSKFMVFTGPLILPKVNTPKSYPYMPSRK